MPQQMAAAGERNPGATDTLSESEKQPQTPGRSGWERSKPAAGVRTASNAGTSANSSESVRGVARGSGTSTALPIDDGVAGRQPAQGTGTKGASKPSKPRRAKARQSRKEAINPGHSIPPPRSVREHHERCARWRELLQIRTPTKLQAAELAELGAYVRQWGGVPRPREQGESRASAKPAATPPRIWYREVLVGRRN